MCKFFYVFSITFSITKGVGRMVWCGRPKGLSDVPSFVLKEEIRYHSFCES